MAQDVLITPASGKIEFKNNTTVSASLVLDAATSDFDITGKVDVTGGLYASTYIKALNEIGGYRPSTSYSGTLLGAVVFNNAIEDVNAVINPAHLNLLSGASERLTVSVTNGGSTVTPDVRLFTSDSNPVQFTVANAATTEVIITVSDIPTVTYTSYIGVTFGNDGFRAKDVKMETFRNGAWQTECDLTDQTENTVVRQINGNNNNGVTQVRYTFKNVANTAGSYFRINTLFLTSYAADYIQASDFGLKYRNYDQYSDINFKSGSTQDFEDGATVNFQNTTGTAPFTVSSTTKVTNLNADTLDGVTSTGFIRGDGTNQGAATIRVDDVDFIVRDNQDSVTNYIWRDHSANTLYLGTANAQVKTRSDITIQTIENNTAPPADDLLLNGYGLMGTRASAPVYITNSGAGGVQIGSGGVHNNSPVAFFDSSGIDAKAGGFLVAATEVIDSSRNATFQDLTANGIASQTDGAVVGLSNSVVMASTATGQLQITGSGYTGAVALGNDGMFIYHNSSSRSLVLGTNETQRIRIAATGGVTIYNGLALNNTNISGVNALSFNDPGPGEGITWTGGNFSIYESPDDLTTNTAGNLQFVSGGTRRATLDTSGNLYVGGSLTNSSITTGTITIGSDTASNAILKLQEGDVTNDPVWWTVADGGNYSLRLNNTGTYPIHVITNATNDAVTSVDIGYQLNVNSTLDVDGASTFNEPATFNGDAGETVVKIIKSFDAADQPGALLIATDADSYDDLSFEIRGDSVGANVQTITTMTSIDTTFAVFGNGHTVIGYNSLGTAFTPITTYGIEVNGGVTAASGFYSGSTQISNASAALLNLTGITTADTANITLYQTDGAAATGSINLGRAGMITFYGNASDDHSIASRNTAGAASDDIRISSYASVILDLDSNSNNSSTADFIIGRHGSGTSSIDTLLTVSGETGSIDTTGDIKGNSARITSYSSGTVPITVGSLRIDSAGKTGWASGDELGSIDWYSADSSGIGAHTVARIVGVNNQGNGSTTTSLHGELEFYTAPYNAVLNTTPVLALKQDNYAVFSGNLGIGTAGDSYLTFGVPGSNSTAGRYISIEGNADSSGEGSGRIFFTEHNSTTGSMSNYGMSIGYRGGSTSIVGADGNTWTGLSAIGNGQWGMWGHDNSATGALFMYGDRAASFVSFPTTVLLPKTGTADATNTSYSSETLEFQASGWDTNGSVARDVKWKIRNIPTASVYPDHDLTFIESDQGTEYTKFVIHGRGSTNYTDPLAASFYGNVVINAGTGTTSGPGDFTVAGTTTTANVVVGTSSGSETIRFPNKNVADNPTITGDKRHLIEMGTNGAGGLWQTTGRGGLMLASADDSVIIASGDVGRGYDPDAGTWHPNPDTEEIYLLTDGSIRFHTGLQDSANYKAFVFDSSGNTTLPGTATASSFVKTSGTASQFLKADGSVDSNTYLTSETSHADVVVDGDFTSQGLMKRGASAGTYSIVTDNSANWDTAYGWGDHSTEGYAVGNLSNYLPLSGGTITHSSNSGFKVTATDSVAGQTFYAMHLDYNLSGGTTFTGDFSHIGFFLDIDSSATGGGTAEEHRIYGIYTDLRVTGDSDLVYASFSSARTDNFSGQVTNLRGANNYAIIHNDSGTVSNAYGAYNYVQDSRATNGVLGTAVGSYNIAYLGSSATDTAAYYASWSLAQISSAVTVNPGTVVAQRAEVQSDARTTGALTVANAYAFQAVFDENDGEDDVTITNGYLFYGDYQGTNPTNAYGVYIVDTVPNYMPGQLTAGNIIANQVRATSDSGIVIRSATNGSGALLKFSDHAGGSYAQEGRIKFYHADGTADGYGPGSYGAAFLVDSTESPLVVNVAGDFVATGAIYANSTEELISGNVTGTLFADVIAANLINADMIAANQIVASKIAADSITANELTANSVQAEQLQISTNGTGAGIFMDGANARIVISD